MSYKKLPFNVIGDTFADQHENRFHNKNSQLTDQLYCFIDSIETILLNDKNVHRVFQDFIIGGRRCGNNWISLHN